MKIIYFTTACEKEDYISFSKNWNTSLNTSIQNLHNRLIRSLALTHEVEVISIRPFSKKYCKLRGLPSALTNEGKITWHYLEIKRNKLAKWMRSFSIPYKLRQQKRRLPDEPGSLQQQGIKEG